MVVEEVNCTKMFIFSQEEVDRLLFIELRSVDLMCYFEVIGYSLIFKMEEK